MSRKVMYDELFEVLKDDGLKLVKKKGKKRMMTKIEKTILENQKDIFCALKFLECDIAGKFKSEYLVSHIANESIKRINKILEG